MASALAALTIRTCTLPRYLQMKQLDADLNLLLAHLGRIDDRLDRTFNIGDEVDPQLAHDRAAVIDRIKQNLEWLV